MISSNIKSLFIFTLLLSLFSISCQTTESSTNPDVRSTVPADANVDEGLFTVHQSGENIYFEIPDSLFGRDMAIMSRIAKTAEGLGWGGDRLAGQQVVHWDRRGDKILLRGVSYSNTADEDLPVYQAVQISNFPTIMYDGGFLFNATLSG